jgi:hypothetical protein
LFAAQGFHYPARPRRRPARCKDLKVAFGAAPIGRSGLAKEGQALISKVYLSARQLIELGATTSIQASAETLTHRKPNNVPFVQEPNFSAIEFEDEFEFEDDF